MTTACKLGCCGAAGTPDFFGLRGMDFVAALTATLADRLAGTRAGALVDVFAGDFAVAWAIAGAERVGFLAVFFFGCGTK
jgi:hypothetical protein